MSRTHKSLRRFAAVAVLGVAATGFVGTPSASAWGAKNFVCDGDLLAAASDSGANYSQTSDPFGVCDPRARFRKSSGSCNFGYAAPGGTAYAPACSGTKIGGSHGGFNDFDTWVSTTT